MKRAVRMFLNHIRREIVSHLLGRELILQKIKDPAGDKIELVDLKRRLNYGRWDIRQIDERDFKLTR